MTVYSDFRQYVDAEENLCNLKTLHYMAGQTPDYEDIHIQQLYLLRYAYSYAFEYKSMYEWLFSRESFRDKIEVTSIGCGNMIDYWGLTKALYQKGAGTCRVIYKGIDMIDWNYKISKRDHDEVYFIKGNATDVLQKSEKLVSNVYIFPKSISEFSRDEFLDICNSFQNKEILRNRIHILISLRTDDGSMERDMNRSEKLANALKSNGFVTQDNVRTYTHYIEETRGIRGLDGSFEYPNEAIDLLQMLNEKCGTYIYNAVNCNENCEKYLCRMPVLTAKQIRYQLLTFDRKDIL